MPEYSNYLESLDPVVGALDGTEIIGASKGGDAKSLTSQQIANSVSPYTTPFPRVDISGTTAYTGTLSPAITAYTNGMKVHVKAKDTSTGGVTLNLNAVGVKQVWKNPTTQASTGDLLDEQGYILEYDSALNGAAGVFLMITGVSSGTVTSVTGTTNRITSTGGATPAIDIDATFEGLLGKVAQRIDQNNAATTSAQLAGVISDDTGSGSLVFATSPTLAGTPLAPTAAPGTNTTQVATTAFVFAEAALKQTLINAAVVLTSGASIDLTAIKHTLTTALAAITFTISHTGDDTSMKVILNATSSVFTFPAGALCVSEGAPTGNNTCPLAGVSGDVYVFAIKHWGSAVYTVVCKNTLQ